MPIFTVNVICKMNNRLKSQRSLRSIIYSYKQQKCICSSKKIQKSKEIYFIREQIKWLVCKVDDYTILKEQVPHMQSALLLLYRGMIT